jgi:hypothetical protein
MIAALAAANPSIEIDPHIPEMTAIHKVNV